MIFNQSEHELQIGTVEIKDGKSSVVLAITGSKSYEPTVIATPYGTNANLNTFISKRCVWETLVVEIPGAATSYDLTKPWKQKYTSTEYTQASANALKFWMRINTDTTGTGDYPDSSGYGNPGSSTQANERPANPAEGPSAYIQAISGKFDTSSVADRIRVTKNSDGDWGTLLGGTNFGVAWTIAFWFKDDGTPTLKPILHFGDSAANNVYRVIETWGNGSDGMMRFHWSNSNGNGYVRPAATQTGDSEWHHFAFTKDNSAYVDSGNHRQGMTFYVDGVEISGGYTTAAGSAPANLSDPKELMVGYFSSTGIDAYLADIAMWNTNLSADQIATIYNASKLGVKSGDTYTGEYWWTVIERSTDIGDVTVQYQAIGASPLRRVK